MRILVTGAFGNIGIKLTEELIINGHEVTAFDLQTKLTKSRHRKLSKRLDYQVCFGNLLKVSDIQRALEMSKPEALMHLAAIVPPAAYMNSKLSEAVNVGGTKSLIEEINRLDIIPRFVFSSSYSCCGSHNATKPVEIISGETEAHAAELYGRQKQTCERIIKEMCAGDWVILRFGRILETTYKLNNADKRILQFLYSMPYDQRCHGCHPEDVALACMNACIVEKAVGKILPIGGDDSWKLTVGEMTNDLLEGVGVGRLSRMVHRKANPEIDSTWYFESWMDTSVSQQILQFQRKSYEEYISEFRKNMRGKRLLIRPVGPFARKYLYTIIPYYSLNRKGRAELPTQPYWDTLRQLYPSAPESYAEAKP